MAEYYTNCSWSAFRLHNMELFDCPLNSTTPVELDCIAHDISHGLHGKFKLDGIITWPGEFNTDGLWY